MTMKTLLAAPAAAAALVATMLGGPAATAQQPLPGLPQQQVRLYNGVTIADLAALIGSVDVNGETFVISRAVTNKGYPYLVLGLVNSGLQFYLSGVGLGYGAPDRYYGYTFFGTPNAQAVANAAKVMQFNATAKFLKLSVMPDGAILSGEHVAAGGVTGANILNAIGTYFTGLDTLAKVFTQTFVSFDAREALGVEPDKLANLRADKPDRRSINIAATMIFRPDILAGAGDEDAHRAMVEAYVEELAGR